MQGEEKTNKTVSNRNKKRCEKVLRKQGGKNGYVTQGAEEDLRSRRF